jgi:hypothetical protein
MQTRHLASINLTPGYVTPRTILSIFSGRV